MQTLQKHFKLFCRKKNYFAECNNFSQCDSPLETQMFGKVCYKLVGIQSWLKNYISSKKLDFRVKTYLP